MYYLATDVYITYVYLLYNKETYIVYLMHKYNAAHICL